MSGGNGWINQKHPNGYCEGQFIKQPLQISKVFLRLHLHMFYIFYLAWQPVVAFVKLMWVISIQSLQPIAGLTLPKRHAAHSERRFMCVLKWTPHSLLLQSQKVRNGSAEIITLQKAFRKKTREGSYLIRRAVWPQFASMKHRQVKRIQCQEVKIFAPKWSADWNKSNGNTLMSRRVHKCTARLVI